MIAYQPSKAAAYGIQFGDQKENGIFKRMGDSDCTNYVSQCIWAGYGGTDGYSLDNPDDIEHLRERVAQNYRQTWTWFGRHFKSTSSFPSNAFIQVEALWNFAVYNTGEGPKAKGYNSGKHWSEMKVLVERGDVLQFFQAAMGRYAHSAIVVSDTHLNIADAIRQTYVAQHSADYSYRPLLSAVMSNDGLEKAKIRILKFQPW